MTDYWEERANIELKEAKERERQFAPFLTFRQSGNIGLNNYNRGNHIYVIDDYDVVIYEKKYFYSEYNYSMTINRTKYEKANNLEDRVISSSNREAYRWILGGCTLLSQAKSVDSLMHRFMYYQIYRLKPVDKANGYNKYRRAGESNLFLFKFFFKNPKNKYDWYSVGPMAMQDAHGRIHKLEEVFRISILDYFKERKIPTELITDIYFRYYGGF